MEGQSQAALLAAQQVESIVAAAQGAADALTRQAEEEAERIRSEARAKADHELAEARRKSNALGQEARQGADDMLEKARSESEQTREQARRAAEARVAAAEEAADQVLSESRVLSTGLRRLGESLSEQGERILRDVSAAHRRMQADLRVGPAEEPRPRRPDSRVREGAEEPKTARRAPADSREEELLATVKKAEDERSGDPPRRPRGRDNPIDDLDVPNWVDS
jgi:hypothetical protein